MKYILSIIAVLISGVLACGQKAPDDRPAISRPEFDKKLETLLNFSVPLIGVEELKNIQSEVHIFDTRKEEEYVISHIPGASHLGYKNPNLSLLDGVAKNDTIVLYCSVGYRSEKIGEQVRALGYTKVFNLYGSLFEWANQGFPMVDAKGQATKKIHTYNRNWGQWVDERKAEKTW